MLLARLVTGRYGNEADERQVRPAQMALGQSWFARLMATIFRRKAG